VNHHPATSLLQIPFPASDRDNLDDQGIMSDEQDHAENLRIEAGTGGDVSGNLSHSVQHYYGKPRVLQIITGWLHGMGRQNDDHGTGSQEVREDLIRKDPWLIRFYQEVHDTGC
jgi:hypothetical protein